MKLVTILVLFACIALVHAQKGKGKGKNGKGKGGKGKGKGKGGKGKGGKGKGGKGKGKGKGINKLFKDRTFRLGTKDDCDDLREEFNEMYTGLTIAAKEYETLGNILQTTYEDSMIDDIDKINGILGIVRLQTSGFGINNPVVSINYVVGPNNAAIVRSRNGWNPALRTRVAANEGAMDALKAEREALTRPCRAQIRRNLNKLIRLKGSTHYVFTKLTLADDLSRICTQPLQDIVYREHEVLMNISNGLFNDLSVNANERTRILDLIEDNHDTLLTA